MRHKERAARPLVAAGRLSTSWLGDVRAQTLLNAFAMEREVETHAFVVGGDAQADDLVNDL